MGMVQTPARVCIVGKLEWKEKPRQDLNQLIVPLARHLPCMWDTITAQAVRSEKPLASG